MPNHGPYTDSHDPITVKLTTTLDHVLPDQLTTDIIIDHQHHRNLVALKGLLSGKSMVNNLAFCDLVCFS